MRVFISSTCYDLIDLRSEIADFFRKAGIDPILSDDPIADFHSKTEANSIEACLANVRSSDAFIIILSNRYGPKLQGVYGEKSATHLEYEEALRHRKQIWMYVRDKTEGEFALWKRNQSEGFKSVWVQKNDWPLFELLEEHRKLGEDKRRPNWFTVFKDSLELKHILKRHFAEAWGNEVARRLFENGRVPFLEITGSFNGSNGRLLSTTLKIQNLSDVPALVPRIKILTEPDTNQFLLKSIKPHETISQGLGITFLAGSKADLQTALSYSNLEGHRFEDLGTITARLIDSHIEVNYTLKRRCYLGDSPEVLLDTKQDL